MNLFQSALRIFESMGVSRNYSSWNGKVLLTFSCFWAHTAANCIYFIRGVHSFSEMANSILIISITTVISTDFVVLAVNKARIDHLIDSSEQITDRGKFHFFYIFKMMLKAVKSKKISAIEINPPSAKMYELTIRQIESWNGIVHIVISKIIPLFVILPQFIWSFVIYFTTGLDEDAFALPTPTW